MSAAVHLFGTSDVRVMACEYCGGGYVGGSPRVLGMLIDGVPVMEAARREHYLREHLVRPINMALRRSHGEQYEFAASEISKDPERDNVTGHLRCYGPCVGGGLVGHVLSFHSVPCDGAGVGHLLTRIASTIDLHEQRCVAPVST